MMTSEKQRKEREIKLKAIFQNKYLRIMKSYTKKIIKNYFLVLFLISVTLFGFSIKTMVHLNSDDIKIRRCGIIEDRKQPVSESGYIDNIFYLRMNYNKKIKKVNVNNTTYYDNKIGDSFCFYFDAPETSSKRGWNAMFLFGMLITAFVFGRKLLIKWFDL